MGPRSSVVAALVTAVGLGCAQPAVAQVTVPIDGVVKGIGAFEGEFKLQSFQVADGILVAKGKLSGTVTNTAGQVVREIKNAKVNLPVDLEKSGFGESPISTAALECNVLNLVLGPLDLNLLGLEISLNQVILNIDADPTGGLLGSLLSILCGLNLADVLGLVLGNLSNLASLLNLILALLSL